MPVPLLLKRRGITPHGVFNPNSIAGLAQWLDATTITGVADATAISTWQDLSSSAATFTQATGAQQPTYYKTTAGQLINGLPVVRFNGGQRMIGNGPGATTTDVTGYFVIKTTTPAVLQIVWEDNTGHFLDGYLTSKYFCFGGPGLLGGTDDSNPHVVSFYSQSASPFAISIKVDGTSVATGNMNNGNLDLSATQLGAQAGPTNAFNGPLGELLIYKALLSGSDDTNVLSYLKTKWGTP